ncbi:MAG TPA: hypothetical protein VFJ61_12630 [Solirubrobacterales bacterium]|nr:hypothetical protein [Solirubrobacterales bacterium]
MPDDPVTDTSKILDTKTFLDDAIASAVKAAGAPRAKPAIGTLILYDAGETAIAKAAGAIQSGFYSSGTLVGVRTWRELTAALARYSSISTLVLFFHSAGGQLIFEGEDPTAEDVRKRFAASGVKVTGAIRFEGCNIMLNPVTTAYLVSGIAGAGAAVSGYTHFSLFNDITVPPGFPRAQAQALLASYAGFWIPGTPGADSVAASRAALKLWLRWFRDEYDETPVPARAAGAEPPRGFIPTSKLEERTVTSGEDALTLEKELDVPVHPAARVTVTDIAAVAAKHGSP